MSIVITRVKFWIFILLHEDHPLSHGSRKKGQVIDVFPVQSSSHLFAVPPVTATANKRILPLMAKALVYVSSSCAALYKGSGDHVSALCALTWKTYLGRYPHIESGDPARVFQLLGWCVPLWLQDLLLGTDLPLTIHFFPCKAFLMYFDTNISAIETDFPSVTGSHRPGLIRLWKSKLEYDCFCTDDRVLHTNIWARQLVHKKEEHVSLLFKHGNCVLKKYFQSCSWAEMKAFHSLCFFYDVINTYVLCLQIDWEDRVSKIISKLPDGHLKKTPACKPYLRSLDVQKVKNTNFLGETVVN